MDRGPQDHFAGSHYQSWHSTGPISFFNPTRRYLPVLASEPKPPRPSQQSAGSQAGSRSGSASGPGATITPSSSDEPLPPKALQERRTNTGPHHGIYHVWRSRDNRKGRHWAVVTKDFVEKAGVGVPKPTNTVKETLRGIGKMFVRFPVWDVSYDVAVIFTLGSCVWVINGFFSWLPLAAPWTGFPGEISVGGGVTAFVGATIFELGSVLLMLEAVNENRHDCFGWALEEAWESGSSHLLPRVFASHDDCRHHHKVKSSWLRSRKHGSSDTLAVVEEAAENADPTTSAQDTSLGAVTATAATTSPTPAGDRDAEKQAPADDSASTTRRWSWWPTWYELKTHYFRDIGFLACLSQMIGATVFWICGFTSLPPIYEALSLPASNGAYWAPQVIGGTGFIISSTLFMIEVQDRWYIPAPKMLGWHIGFWNLLGAIGFTLCGALGFAIEQPMMPYASSLASFIGSWSFLIGSAIQWFESLDKYPISVEEAPPSLAVAGTA